jgi:hypothetical protein
MSGFGCGFNRWMQVHNHLPGLLLLLGTGFLLRQFYSAALVVGRMLRFEELTRSAFRVLLSLGFRLALRGFAFLERFCIPNRDLAALREIGMLTIEAVSVFGSNDCSFDWRHLYTFNPWPRIVCRLRRYAIAGLGQDQSREETNDNEGKGKSHQSLLAQETHDKSRTGTDLAR